MQDDTPHEDTICGWAPVNDALYRGYHDQEWGVPEYDSRALWEKFQLDGHQAGLSWITILRKRDTMRAEFDNFDPQKIALWDEARIEKALLNPGIIRSRLKVEATVSNAKLYLAMEAKGETFSDYLWGFIDGKPIVNSLDYWKNVSAKSPISEAISKDMKKRGFKFCGPVIVYAAMQAVGMINDHEIRCSRYKQVQEFYR